MFDSTESHQKKPDYLDPTSGVSLRLHQAGVLLAVIAPLLGVIVAIVRLWQWLVTWPDIALLLGMYFCAGLGVTTGFHRMLTHRSFEAHPALRFLLLALGSMAVEGGALSWASLHIQHHACSDREGDPHSPLEGFFHAHLGWLFNMQARPEIYGSWLLKDSMVCFFERSFFFWVILGLLIPYLLGGWTGLLWGGLVRIFLGHHVTWSINSVCHTFGQRTFETNDRSTNQWLVGLLALGEGWHNNHHAFPRSAFHGLYWWQFDLTGYLIRGLEWLGLAWQVYRISPANIRARLAKDRQRR